ncbi:MAG TPA: MTH938/NDUFAF3 family protein [Beijerinckiaceae bacterium]|nr:MTH938/NDUFAF3 family protein [Beijerinckiaceae bacterium]
MAEPGRGFVPGRHPIEGIGRGGFVFAGMSHIGSVLALPSGVHAWAVSDPVEITPESLALAVAEAGDFEFLILGTGARQAFPTAAVRAVLAEAGLRCEAMATPMATQTYNILLDEGRRVAAALIAVA